jgi:HAD superfamily hydrolase (TIGR01458 family)
MSSAESRGLRAALIDVDGVLHIGDVPLPGSVAALAELRQRGIPFRLLTNSTTRTRGALAEALRGMGFDVADTEVLTAPVATAAWLRRRYPGVACYPIVTGNVLADFAGVPMSDGPDARVVVIGGAEDNFTFHALNHAFRLLLAGAALVAMHRNPWWVAPEGPALDAGAFVRALEHASGRRATVVGKPAAPFFRSAFRSLGLPPSQVIMVGDDLRQDILPSMRLGATGALVRTGKFREADLVGGTPHLLLDSLAGLPRVFDDASE